MRGSGRGLWGETGGGEGGGGGRCMRVREKEREENGLWSGRDKKIKGEGVRERKYEMVGERRGEGVMRRSWRRIETGSGRGKAMGESGSEGGRGGGGKGRSKQLLGQGTNDERWVRGKE